MVETTMSGSKYILCRLDNELKVMEEKHAVSARWLPNAKRYEECERTLLFSKVNSYYYMYGKLVRGEHFCLISKGSMQVHRYINSIMISLTCEVDIE